MDEIDLNQEYPLLSKERTLVKKYSGAGRYAAEKLLSIISTDEEAHHDLVPSYIMTLCSGMEARINNNIVDYFFKKTGKEYKLHAKPYMLLPFERKIAITIPLISNYKYKLNAKSKNLKEVLKVFKLRNRMVHMADEYVDGFKLNYERFYDFEISDKDRAQYYSNDEFKDQSTKDLKKYFHVYEKFIIMFCELFPRINYKRFKPEEWFIHIES